MNGRSDKVIPMWAKYSEPPLVLPPKHAAVFRYAASGLVDFSDDDDLDDGETSGDVFDKLSRGERLAAILVVSKALLDSATESPEDTAALAATVSAIYDYLEAVIDAEAEAGETTIVRSMVLEALDEKDYWNIVGRRRLSPRSRKMDEWSHLVEALRGEVLEDEDFKMESRFLDASPDKAAHLKAEMHIDPDYFVTPVEDPSPKRLDEIRKELQRLLSQG